MTQRTMPTQGARALEIRSGGDVTVTGWDNASLEASSASFLGLKLERRDDVIRVNLGGSGEVRVPRGLPVQVHAGRSADVRGLQSDVSVFTGWALTLETTGALLRSGAGGQMWVRSARLSPDVTTISAGRGLRLQVADLTDRRVTVNDIGGGWEITFGTGSQPLKINAGGDVVIVTDQDYAVTSPNGIAGLVERPSTDLEPRA